MNFYQLPQDQLTSSHQVLDSDDYELVVRQQPKEALVTQHGKEKNRKPVDPPPIIELKVTPSKDPTRQFLQSPYLFMQCTLQVDAGNESSSVPAGQEITGQSVSSLHKLKDINNEDGGFFVFGDISIRLLGRHRLNFSLFELRKETGDVAFLKSITSDYFDVVQPKQWRGLEESTHLSRTFSDQGVRLRLRKENRNISQKRSYPFSPQGTAHAGPSSAVAEQAGTAMFGGAQPLTGPYGTYSEVPPKRHRSDDYGQPQAYAPADRAMPGFDTRAGAPMPPGYPLPATASRQSPQQAAYGMQTPVANPNWQQQQYYAQGSSSAPARVMEGDVQTAQGLTPSASFGLQPGALGAESSETYARRGTGSYLTLQQQAAQTSPTTPYQQGAGDAMYGHPTSASMAAPTAFIESAEPTAMSRQHTHTQPVTSPASSTRSGMNLAAPVFPMPSQQLPPQSYNNTLPDPLQYTYAQPTQQYRPAASFQAPSTPLLQQPLATPHTAIPLRPQQHQQPDPFTHPPHGYPQGYHQAPGSGTYPPTSQGQDRPWH